MSYDEICNNICICEQLFFANYCFVCKFKSELEGLFKKYKIEDKGIDDAASYIPCQCLYCTRDRKLQIICNCSYCKK